MDERDDNHPGCSEWEPVSPAITPPPRAGPAGLGAREATDGTPWQTPGRGQQSAEEVDAEHVWRILAVDYLRCMQVATAHPINHHEPLSLRILHHAKAVEALEAAQRMTAHAHDLIQLIRPGSVAQDTPTPSPSPNPNQPTEPIPNNPNHSENTPPAKLADLDTQKIDSEESKRISNIGLSNLYGAVGQPRAMPRPVHTAFFEDRTDDRIDGDAREQGIAFLESQNRQLREALARVEAKVKWLEGGLRWRAENGAGGM